MTPYEQGVDDLLRFLQVHDQEVESTDGFEEWVAAGKPHVEHNGVWSKVYTPEEEQELKRLEAIGREQFHATVAALDASAARSVALKAAAKALLKFDYCSDSRNPNHHEAHRRLRDALREALE